jgi:type I site-specific restriction endonuclease
VCREIVNERHKMLVEMATGTGKTRTTAALLKRLFEKIGRRALFDVDRNTLAIPAEDAFADPRPASPKSAAGAVKARKKTVSVVFQNQRDVALGKPGGANGRDWILVRRRE